METYKKIENLDTKTKILKNVHQKRRTFTNFTKRHTSANFPQENEENKIIGIDKNLKIRLEEWKVLCPCFKCKYEEQRQRFKNYKKVFYNVESHRKHPRNNDVCLEAKYCLVFS